MQIKSLRLKSYRSWAVNDRASVEALARLQKLEWYEKLRQEGCSSSTRLEIIGWSRATYYRNVIVGAVWGGWRVVPVVPGLEHFLQTLPVMGQMWRVLVRDHGWTLSYGRADRDRADAPGSDQAGGVLLRTGFQRHWRYGMKGRQPGELVQLDHMSLSFPQGKTLIQTKWCVCAYTAGPPVARLGTFYST